jgi:flagellar basal body L-ring protein FlgH
MSGQRSTFLTITGVVLLLAAAAAEAAAAEQAKPAVQPPAAASKQPNDEGAPTTPNKLVAPVRGQAEIAFTKPVSKNDGKFITTTIRIKNMSSGAIAGLKVDEYWYDKEGNTVTGSPSFRHRKPLQPGEVIDVTLKVPVDKRMNRNQYKFEHANGTIKTTGPLPKL